MMRIILREDVPNLGVVGDLVSVKDGYARNYLIPQGKAEFASVRSIRELDHQKRLAAHRREEATKDARAAKTKIEGLSVAITAKVAPAQLGEDGEPIRENLQKLFGSITNRDLAKVLADSGIKVEHRRISIDTPVRTVGKFSAKVRLDGGIIAELAFWVLPEGCGDIEAAKKAVEQAQEEAAAEEARLAAPKVEEAPAEEAAEGEEAAAEEAAAEGENAEA